METVRAIVGPVSLFVGTESASTLRITRFADNTVGTLHRRICLPLNSANSQLALCYFLYAHWFPLQFVVDDYLSEETDSQLCSGQP